MKIDRNLYVLATLKDEQIALNSEFREAFYTINVPPLSVAKFNFEDCIKIDEDKLGWRIINPFVKYDEKSIACQI